MAATTNDDLALIVICFSVSIAIYSKIVRNNEYCIFFRQQPSASKSIIFFQQ